MTTQIVERIAFEVDGEGDPVLLIHGLGGSSNTWTPIMAALARHKAIRVDLPGSARSATGQGALSIARFRQGGVRGWGGVGVTRMHVIAHSLGTIVAQHLAVAEPGMVRSLALFG